MIEGVFVIPVEPRLGEIVEAVFNFPVVIIRGGTGVGKSALVPPALMKAGYTVEAAEPRRFVVRNLASTVSRQLERDLGTTVGFLTAYEKCRSDETLILYCTDGLVANRGIAGHRNGKVLIIDEVHEWNLNIETLIALAKSGALGYSRIVIMSATMDAHSLAAFFGNDVPVIEIEERQYPIEWRFKKSYELVSSIRELVELGINTLVFVPGKAEIYRLMEDLADCNAVLLPLHAELEIEEQQKCFGQYDRPKVVIATTIAQTAVTIPDFGAVVDTGLERRKEITKDGIESLAIGDISQADCEQRAGRGGRTRASIYILCSDTDYNSRPKYAKPEISRTRLDQMVLRLLAHGIDPTTLEFYHQPPIEALQDAKKSLATLGAIDASGYVTKIGREMANFPINTNYARMIVEAQKRGVVADVITIAAILEAQGIRQKDRYSYSMFGNQTKSDLLEELELFKRVLKVKSRDLKFHGVNAQRYGKAREIRRKLVEVLGQMDIAITSNGNQRAILLSCIAGMVDHLYRYNGAGGYVNGTSIVRQLDRNSVVTPSDWIVGLPLDIEVRQKYCRQTLKLVTMATAVDPADLVEIAPHLARTQDLGLAYDPKKDRCFAKAKVYFGQQEVEELHLPPKESEQESLPLVFASWIAKQCCLDDPGLVVQPANEIIAHNRAVIGRAIELNNRSGEYIFPEMTEDDLADWIAKRLDGASSFAQVNDPNTAKLADLNAEIVAKIERDNPASVMLSQNQVAVIYQRDPSGFYAKIVLPDLQSLQGHEPDQLNNRVLRVEYGGIIADSFKELVAKLDLTKIESKWKFQRYLNDFENSDPVRARNYVSFCVNPVKILGPPDGNIYGYDGISYDPNKGWKVRLFESKVEATVGEKEALVELIKALLKKEIVPQPWESDDQIESSGKLIADKIQEISDLVAGGIEAKNFEERLLMAKELLKQALKGDIA